MADVDSEVTVVIPARSFSPLTRWSLAGIRARYPRVPVVVVVDTEPPDPQLDPHTRVVTSADPLLGAKRNLAVAGVDTSFVAFIDNDAYPDAGWLERALAAFEREPDLGVVGGPNVLPPGSGRQEYLSWLSCQSYLVSGGSVHEKVRSPSRWVERVPSCNLVTPRALYEELGGFSTDVVTGEDIEYCIQVVQSGRRILFAEDVVVFHKARDLRGFFWQRYVWGKSTFDVLRRTFPRYLSSILPFAFVSTLGVLGLAGAFMPAAWALLALLVGAHAAAVLFEAGRVGTSLRERLALVPYIAIGNLAPGVGAVVAFFVGDSIRSYRVYRNEA